MHFFLFVSIKIHEIDFPHQENYRAFFPPEINKTIIICFLFEFELNGIYKIHAPNDSYILFSILPRKKMTNFYAFLMIAFGALTAVCSVMHLLFEIHYIFSIVI